MSEKSKTFLTGIFSVAITSIIFSYFLNIGVDYWDKNIYPNLSPDRKAEWQRTKNMSNMEYLKYDWKKFKAERGWK